jgi:hypothetical protein
MTGDEMTGDKMTGDEMYEGTKLPGQNDRDEMKGDEVQCHQLDTVFAFGFIIHIGIFESVGNQVQYKALY